ncbi:MAG TPA: polysaccharide biosynthesis tyrosine autokinase [Geminicoccus sp.]|jgi:uncharacterized protein involved in exopolysaccharide biosynthesis/Mrp family chromosome partitioning ATPase|uniref:GumC family protein n=1 Tax=Geminicoccus sp. TaxID=2024832 RepID=UPI002E37B4A4|nr:polysaccharide biosynthesis tyrosine autokinase [Geminicoccus sp.]HEX2526155.1 polysaccharide biosynthesis tyrosine autokinase [Geminicoccus sp.]
MAVTYDRAGRQGPLASQGRSVPFYVSAFDEFPGPSEILRVLKRHKLLVAFIVLPVTAMATTYGVLAPQRYTASAMIALDPKDAPLRNLGTLPGGLIRDMPILETQLHVVVSPVVLGEVADRLHLADNPTFVSPPSVKTRLVEIVEAKAAPFQAELGPLKTLLTPSADPAVTEPTRDDVVNALARNLEVATVGQSYAMTLSYRATDPVLAASVVNETARAYVRHQLKSKLATTSGASSYLETRLATLRSEVEEAESELEAYRAQNSLPIEGNDEPLSRRVNELNLELIGVRSEIAVTSARVEALKGLQADADPTVLARAMESQTAETLSLEAVNLARRRAELQLSFGDQHPSVQALRADEAALRRKIRDEAERNLAEVTRSLDLLRVKADEITREIKTAEAKIAADQHAMVQIANLKRDADVNRRLYEEMLTQRKLLAEQQSLVQPDVEIIAEASADIRSSSPPLFFYLLIGFVGSSALAMLLALLRDRADPRVRSARQLERLTGHQILARLPTERQFRRLRPEQFVELHPNGAYAESLRHAYLELEARRPERESLVVLVTSTLQGEGKSSTVSGLAGLLRRSGKRVVVIDLDLRRPRLSRLFPQEEQAVTINELLQSSNEVWETHMARLLTRPSSVVLPAEPAGDEVLPLLESRQLSATIKALRLRYDYVLLDTPPVLPTSDATFLMRHSDVALMVCRWLVTEVSAVREAAERLDVPQGAPLLGIILNMIDPAGYKAYAPSYGERTPLDGSYPYGSAKK